jgi:hypothetical protein
MGNQSGRMGGLMGMGNQAGRAGGLMGMGQAGRAAGGAGSSLLGNSGGIMNFLNNTQQVLRTAQSIGPMVQQFQQYGHLVKNIPAMWKLYRGLKNAPDASETDSKTSSSSKKSSSPKVKNSQSEKRKNKRSSENRSSKTSSSSQIKENVTWKKQTSSSHVKGSSSPKLYI